MGITPLAHEIGRFFFYSLDLIFENVTGEQPT